MSAQSALDVADWRRRVFALYQQVRENPDAAAAHRDWVTGRDALFARHPSTPLLPEHRDDFGGLPVAEYDPAWRFELELEPTEEQRLEVETGTDGVVPFERIGVVRVPDVGTLDVWRLASYGGGLFLPVKDPSPDTYGGGRYLLDTVKGADLGGGPGRLVVDLNFAYHPSCAYDPRWSCPLAPEGNRVPAPVAAGEQLPPGGWYQA